MTMSNFNMKKRSLNLNSSNMPSTEIDSSANQMMNTTALTSSDVGVSKGVFSHRRSTHAESMYRVTQSSNLLGLNPGNDGGKPNIKVQPLEQDEGILYMGTFESSKKNSRITLYRARITPDETQVPMELELQRDINIQNKLFIVLRGIEEYQIKELNITLKQATNLLIRCKHDFRQFVSELLCVKQGEIAVRNLSFKVFDPTQGNYS